MVLPPLPHCGCGVGVASGCDAGIILMCFRRAPVLDVVAAAAAAGAVVVAVVVVAVVVVVVAAAAADVVVVVEYSFLKNTYC